MIKQYLLILLVLLLAGCASPPKKAVVKQSHKPPINTEVDPRVLEVISTLVHMKSDPNIFKYREPSLDEKFGIGRYKQER